MVKKVYVPCLLKRELLVRFQPKRSKANDLALHEIIKANNKGGNQKYADK